MCPTLHCARRSHALKCQPSKLTSPQLIVAQVQNARLARRTSKQLCNQRLLAALPLLRLPPESNGLTEYVSYIRAALSQALNCVLKSLHPAAHQLVSVTERPCSRRRVDVHLRQHPEHLVQLTLLALQVSQPPLQLDKALAGRLHFAAIQQL